MDSSGVRAIQRGKHPDLTCPWLAPRALGTKPPNQAPLINSANGSALLVPLALVT